MNDAQCQFLSLLAQPPARLTVEQAAWVLNCQPHDIPILVTARLLKPLGTPRANSTKYFSLVEVSELARDPAWLARVTNALYEHWRERNDSKTSRCRLSTLGKAEDTPPESRPGLRRQLTQP